MILLAPGGRIVASPETLAPSLLRSGLMGSARVGPSWIAVAVCMILGFGLRLAAARGDLWLDELWSLNLVSHISSPDQVFWNISHDNNHFLNSLWMFLVGQNAAPIVYRLPSVLFGTAAIFVAARIGARVNPAAAVAAAVMAACSYVVVDYGSEARGYSGLILAVFLAIDLSTVAVDRLLAPGLANDDHRSRLDTACGTAARRLGWPLAGAILFGACSHLTMLVEAVVLAAATVLRLKGAGLPFRAALDETVALFRPSLIVLLPLLAALAAGAALHHEFTIGGFLPFTVGRYLHGYGGLLQMMLGLPDTLPNGLGLAVPTVLLVAAASAGLLHARWLALVVVAMVIWPAAIFALRVPNTDYARYFLTAGLVLPILLAEIAGHLWCRGWAGRVAAGVGVAAICVGQVPYLRQLIIDHRGSPVAAVALMAEGGSATFAARNPMLANPVVDVYADRLSVDLKPASMAGRCQAPPGWFVFDADYGEPAPDRLHIDGPGCTIGFKQVAAFPAALWSGRSWTIYRRESRPIPSDTTASASSLEPNVLRPAKVTDTDKR